MSDIVYAGDISIGAVEPTATAAFTADASLLASFSASASADLSATVDANANFSANPPSFAASITTLTNLIAEIQLAITLGVPSVNADIGVQFSAKIALLTALTASLSAQLTVLANLASLLGTAGVLAYSWDGTGATFGADVNAVVGTGWPNGATNADPANAIILATTTPATWAAMQTFFAGAF